jgi:hypothetical protein
MKNSHKIVVFDLDETLGYFTEFGIFCDCLDNYFNNYYNNNEYSKKHFNDLLNLFPEFLRPNIVTILQYLKEKKQKNKCYKVMIYTNNQGDKSWVISIKNYFDKELNYKLFDQVIAAFKVKGQHVEMGRTSHDKTIDDLITCTKLPENIEICFIDDVYHPGMTDDNVYYINVKPYQYKLSIEYMVLKFLDSSLSKNIKVKDKQHFVNNIKTEFKKYNYLVNKKTKEEHSIDKIITKRMLQHLKEFFNEL